MGAALALAARAKADAARANDRGTLLLPGRRIGFLGDSITNRSSAALSTLAYPDQLIEMLGAGAAPLGAGSVLSGHPGFRSDQIEPFMAGNIIAAGCQVVVIEQGVNDAAQGASLSSFATSMLNQLRAARAAGLQIYVMTVLPRGQNASPTAVQNRLIDSYNAWLRLAVPGYGTLVDVRTALQDPTAAYNRLLPAYDSGDGVHPNSMGHWVMAATLARAMRPTMRRTQILDGFSTFNLVSNPYFFGASSAGWYEVVSPAGTGTTPTYSFVTDTSGALAQGMWREMAFAPGATSGTRQYETGISSGFTAGDTLALTLKAQVEDAGGIWRAISPSGNGTGNIGVRVVNGVTGAPLAAVPSPITGSGFPSTPQLYDHGPMWQTFTVPAGTTVLGVRLSVVLPGGASLKVRIGEIGLLNLTAAGMAGVPLQ